VLSEALGFSYRPADELARRPVEEIVQRVTAIMGKGTPATVSTAVMGGGTVDQDLPARNEYLATENRILKDLLLSETQTSFGRYVRSTSYS
jgi:hypothetical protein